MVDISNPLWTTIDANNSANSPNGWNSSTTQSQTIPISQATMGAVKRLYERMGPVLTSTGSANNYVVTPSNNAYPTALVQGDTFCYIASFPNAGSSTLAYNGLPPVTIKKPGSSGPINLSGGEIQTGQVVVLRYDGINFHITSLIPISSTSSGTVTSVAMTGDNVIYNTSITGSPITSSGTLVPVLKAQTANKILAGPTTGSSTAPTFRSMVLSDLPAQTGTGNIVLSASPTLSGTPIAPTATAGTNTTQLATTAFVQAAVSPGTIHTWTPVINFGAATTGITYSTQAGTYLQSGKMVIAEFSLTLSSKGSATGNATITGLPVANNGSGISAQSLCNITGFANMSSISSGFCNGVNGTTILLELTGTTGQTAVTDANFTDTTIFQGSAIYIST